MEEEKEGEFGIKHIGKDGNRCKNPNCPICNPEDEEEWKKKNLKREIETE